MPLDSMPSPARGRRAPDRLPLTPTMRRVLMRNAVEDIVAAAYAIERTAFRCDTKRRRNVLFPRRLAMYLLHVVAGVNLGDIGNLYGRDRRTASYSCAWIERARDEPGLDEVIGLLEPLVALRCRPFAPDHRAS